MNRVQVLLVLSLVWLTVISCTKEQVEYNWEQIPGKPVLLRSDDLTLLKAEDAMYSKDMTINKAVTGIGNWKRTDQWFRWKIQSEKN